jgi:hypothetical protein
MNRKYFSKKCTKKLKIFKKVKIFNFFKNLPQPPVNLKLGMEFKVILCKCMVLSGLFPFSFTIVA